MMGAGRHAEAIPILRQLVARRPSDPEPINLLGVCLLAVGRPAEAEAAFIKLLTLQPASPPAFANLGMALRLQNRSEEAVEAFRQAVAFSPDHAPNYLQLFKQLQQLSRWDEAIRTLEDGIERHPESPILLEALAAAYGRTGRGVDAETIFRRIAPVNASAANQYAQWLQEEGRFAESVPVLEGSLALQPRQGAPYRHLVEAKQSFVDGKPIRETAEALFADPSTDISSKMHLAYALGKLHDMQRNYPEAMRWFDAANSIAYRVYPAPKTFDPEWTTREPQLIAQIYNQAFLDRLTAKSSRETSPIFIVGMIRSGTTLLDQIVSSHPAVISVGESPFWNAESSALHRNWPTNEPDEAELADLADRYLAAIGMRGNPTRFTDKMPLNYRSLGPILAAFPKAKILHIRRDPFDTCMSIYTTFFAGGPNFAYHQENIVLFYLAYLGHMEHWRATLPQDRFFELDYADLVSDPEPTIRATLEFLELPWNEAVLHHERNASQVATPSRWQARQPIYKTSLGKREAYAHLAPVFALLPRK